MVTFFLNKEPVNNMLLVIDVGNTHTVIGVFRGSELVQRWRMATNKLHTADELRLKLQPLLASAELSAQDLDGACIASVVPKLTDAWGEAAFVLLGVMPVICNARAAGALFETDYPNPSEIGADRVADAVGAKALYGSPVVTVDFGTATNMEVIDKDGKFVGGVIAPGIDTSASALTERATKLGAIDFADPHTAIGRNTAEAMQVGIVYGEADRVDGIVNRIFDQLGYRAPVIATGGLAYRVAKISSTITDTNPDLTLEGLRLVYNEFVGNHG